ncbi:MAG TPA: hypothetical protein VME43_02035 [Bryobacteraceae bacterium]|nr:hypothetical protein [Bryobacteraceae bacterium]
MTLVRCLLLAPVLVFAAWGQTAGEAPGPTVGAHVPAFQLPDQNGQMRDLGSLYGPKGLMLVFFRSADW